MMANNSSFYVSTNCSAPQGFSDDQLKQRVALGIDITIFVVAVLGNFLVLLVIYRTRERRKTPFEILIANLSVADILTVLLYFSGYYFSIPVSKWSCKLVSPFFSSTQMVSMLTMTTIAIFRCRSIVHPFKTKPSTKLTCCTVLGLWILANVCLLSVYLVREKYSGWCTEMWPSQLLNKVYTVSLAVVQYVIPLTIMAVCYTRIVVYLKRHRGSQCGLNNDRINQMKMARKRDMEVIKISLIIVLLYNVSTLPIHVAWISRVVFDSNVMSNALAQFSGQLSFLHCCCNPFVYGTISREFRSRIIQVFCSLFCSTCNGIRRVQIGVLQSEHGQKNDGTEDLKMIEMKGYVEREGIASYVQEETNPSENKDEKNKRTLE